MKNFSIVRIGQEYVVRAGEKSIIKVASRRQAARLVTEAAELLHRVPAVCTAEDASLACEGGIAPESAKAP
jgi:hypothetical protein